MSLSSAGIDAVLQAPPPSFSTAQACEIGRAAFGIEAVSARSLGSERDQAFLLTGESAAGMAVLKPLLSAHDSGVQPAGVLLMGTVRGDLHDIGKNLVGMMAEGAGFEVHDIGVDQSIEKFLAASEKYKPDIIGMSALLTTTMTYMKTVIDGFEKAGRLSHPRPSAPHPAG